MKKLGVVVNPIAGIGGRVGLKGSDGIEILTKARQLGAQSESPKRTVEALKIISKIKDSIEVITYPKEMGEEECREAGLRPTVIGSIKTGETTPKDTQNAAKEMEREGVDLLLFAGGDGTARDIYNAFEDKLVVLGIPAGVKIHSAVYAVTPRSAGEVVVMYLDGALMHIHEAEVMDIDEDAFRDGMVVAKLYGYLRVPEERKFLQRVKSGSMHSEKEALHGIAEEITTGMSDDCFYIIGPGTTTRDIVERLGLRKTLLGVDIICNKVLVSNDATESQILDLIDGERAKIIVTVIGGQGFIFGRGNQQISPRVIREVGEENIIVVATKEKLISLCGRPLYVDTIDEELNQKLSGYIKVTTGFEDYVVYKVGW